MLDLTVNVYNISKGHNDAILARSMALNEYVTFIDRVKQNKENGLTLDEASTEAVRYCIT
jgi:hypothetical protein